MLHHGLILKRINLANLCLEYCCSKNESFCFHLIKTGYQYQVSQISIDFVSSSSVLTASEQRVLKQEETKISVVMHSQLGVQSGAIGSRLTDPKTH